MARTRYPGPKHVSQGVADAISLILAAEVGAPLAPKPEPALGGRRIACLPHQLTPETLDFTRLIRAGETVGWAEATAEPVFLTRLLDAQAVRCPPFRVFFPLTFSNTLGAGHPQVTVTALGGAQQAVFLTVPSRL